jgi:AcrR family transcriptional regulator
MLSSMSTSSTTTTRRRQRNPRGEGERLRDELIAAAIQLLEHHGSDKDLSLRGVAREAGVAAPSIYRHFSDIRELNRAVLDVCFDELGGYLNAAVGMAGTDPAGRLRAHANAWCRFAVERPGIYHALFGVTTSPYPDPTPEQLAGWQVFQDWVELVADYLRSDRESAVTPVIATICLWGALHGLVALRISKPNFPWPPLEQLIDHTLATELGLR